MSVALRYAARSDVGLVRSNNQDSAYAGPHLLVVADGMGGHAGGDVASSVAVAALAPLDDEAHGPDDALDELEGALEAAREEIIARSEEEPDLAGMGTTVTAILRAGNKLAMVHLGDSRGYVLRAGLLTQVTVDHTFVQHLVDTGKITPEEAEHHPQRSVIMRVLGDFDPDVTPDLSVREARPGDRWMLCSDGLSGFVSAETIADTMRAIDDVDACADRLVQLALRAGGGDNVTVIVADVIDLDDLADGAGPTTASTIVGAAATTRSSPTSAGDGPAARAATLSASARAEQATEHDEQDADDDGELDDRPRRHWLTWTVVVLVLALVGGGGYAGYRWTQTQYYVGTADGRVALFQGIPESLGPFDLSTLVETSTTSVGSLSTYLQSQVDDTIGVDSEQDGRDLIAQLADDAAAGLPAPAFPGPAGPTPAPSPSPVAAPSDVAATP